MRKLKHVRYTNSRKIDDKLKDKMLVPDSYSGLIAIETWEVNGKLIENFVRVANIRDYLLGLGSFGYDEK